MYLTKRTYVQNWEHMGPEERHKITIKGPRAKAIKPERISYIIEQVGYWRKANQIHAWFVKHVQDGKDDCGTYRVDHEQLQELLKVCQQVLAESKLVDGKVENGYEIKLGASDGRLVKIPNLEDGKFIADPSAAIKLLPTESGFFFGGTDYDEDYFEDLRNTVKILEEALKDEDADFYYEASW